MPFELREYQEKAVSNVLADWRDGYERVLVMAATGTGKTQIYLALCDAIIKADPRARILILAHTQELIYQPIERAMDFFPQLGLKMGIVMANHDNVQAQVVVATVQTLSKGNRLSEVLRFGQFTHVICDEAHHRPADVYAKISNQLGDALEVGFTATPKRTDDVALGLVYKKVSFKYTIQDAIRDGWLCPFTPLGFYLPVIIPHDLEFKDGDDPKVGKLLSADNVLEIVYEKWLDNAANRQTIGFTASVVQAHTMAEYFSAMGTPAMAIDGTTKDEDRKRILTSYKKGEIKALWNCQVLTEGFDAPETSCLLMVAPTRSDLVYTQRLGRGLRLFPGKEDCLILDFAPSNVRDLVFSVDLLDGIPKRITEQREKAEQQGVLFSGFAVNRMGEVGFIDPHDVTAKVLQFLGKNKLAWTFDGKAASATVNQSTTLMILMPERDRIEKADELRREKGLNDKQKAVLDWISQYRVYSVIKRMGENQKGSDTRLETVASTIDEAKTFCESAFEPDGLGLKRKPWRDGPMSDKQAELLKRIGGYKPNLTKGQAAQQITHSLAFKAVQGMETAKQEQVFRQVAK